MKKIFCSFVILLLLIPMGVSANVSDNPNYIKSEEEMLKEMQSKTADFTISVYAAGFVMKKGDILVTNGTSASGITGHAGIATSNNWVLDAPGYSINGKNTTRQTKVSTWLNQYKKYGNIWVYRAKNATVASEAAYWADRTYYSSKGSTKQDRFPKYSLWSNLSTTDKTYCSKLVWQAFYYGTGNKTVMKSISMSSKIGPYQLGDAFTNAYKPTFGVAA